MKERSCLFLGILLVVLCSFMPKAELSTSETNTDSYVQKKSTYTIVSQNGKLGCVDQNRSVVIPELYDAIHVFPDSSFFSYENLCAVKRDGKWGLINEEDSTVVDFKYDSIKCDDYAKNIWIFVVDDRIIVKKDGSWGVINEKGKTVISFKYEEVSAKTGYGRTFYVKKNGKWGLYDDLGRQLLPIKFDEIRTGFIGTVRVKKDNKWGLFDVLGMQIIPVKYDTVEALDSVYVKDFLHYNQE